MWGFDVRKSVRNDRKTPAAFGAMGPSPRYESCAGKVTAPRIRQRISRAAWISPPHHATLPRMSTTCDDALLPELQRDRLRPYLLAILVVNSVNQFLLLPQAQQQTNSHIVFVGSAMPGPFFGTAYSLVAMWLLLRGMVRYVNEQDLKSLLCTLTLVASFTYWGCKFFLLFCEGCANSG